MEGLELESCRRRAGASAMYSTAVGSEIEERDDGKVAARRLLGLRVYIGSGEWQGEGSEVVSDAVIVNAGTSRQSARQRARMSCAGSLCLSLGRRVEKSTEGLTRPPVRADGVGGWCRRGDVAEDSRRRVEG